MRQFRIELLWTLGIAALLGSQAATAAPDNACTLLTRAQIEAAMGTKISEGSSPSPGMKGSCRFPLVGDQYSTEMAVTISSPMYFDSAKKSATDGQTVTPAPGIGDDAFFLVNMGGTTLYVKKGNGVFNLSLNASIPGAKAMEAEKALGKIAASKF